MKKLLGVIIMTVSLSLVWALSVEAANGTGWPMFHGGPARTGFSDSAIPSSPSLLWEITTSQLKEFGVDEFEVQAPIIDQGKVFFSSGQVFAADLDSGKILWNYKGDKEDFYAGPGAAGDGRVFVKAANSNNLQTMSEGFIYALGENTGQLLWKYQIQKPASHSDPLLAEGKVFIGDDSGSVYALEAATGKLIWQKQLEAYQIHSSPAYDDGVIYVGTETEDTGGGRTDRGSYLYALDAGDGRVLWQFESDWRSNEMPNLIHGTPAVANGAVYFGSENGWFYALNGGDGSVIWKKIITKGTKTSAQQARSPGLVGVSTAPALGYGKVFVGTWEGKFLALDQKDGTVVWEYPFGTEGTNSSAVVADNKVCLGSHYLDFYCFNQENGKVLWQENLGGPSAALAEGILIVPNALAGESPGSILLAFTTAAKPGTAFDPRYLLAVLAAVLMLGLGVVVYKALKSRKITPKRLLICGGIFLILIAGGYIIYSMYQGERKDKWTETQDKLRQEGKLDPATGSLIEEGSPKHVKYQGKRYLLDGGFCPRSNLERLAIRVERFNGAAAADGEEGNTMYALGGKDNPNYISSSKTPASTGDCWKLE